MVLNPPPTNCVQAIFRARARMLTFRGSRCAKGKEIAKITVMSSSLSTQTEIFQCAQKENKSKNQDMLCKTRKLDILQEEEMAQSHCGYIGGSGKEKVKQKTSKRNNKTVCYQIQQTQSLPSVAQVYPRG